MGDVGFKLYDDLISQQIFSILYILFHSECWRFLPVKKKKNFFETFKFVILANTRVTHFPSRNRWCEWHSDFLHVWRPRRRSVSTSLDCHERFYTETRSCTPWPERLPRRRGGLCVRTCMCVSAPSLWDRIVVLQFSSQKRHRELSISDPFSRSPVRLGTFPRLCTSYRHPGTLPTLGTELRSWRCTHQNFKIRWRKVTQNEFRRIGLSKEWKVTKKKIYSGSLVHQRNWKIVCPSRYRTRVDSWKVFYSRKGFSRVFPKR